jgi:hypothetical protein
VPIGLLLSRPRGCDGSTAARGAPRLKAELSGRSFVPDDTAEASCEEKRGRHHM